MKASALLDCLTPKLDAQVLLDTLKFMIKLGKTPPFSKLVAQQTYPPSEVQSDEDLISYARLCASSRAPDDIFAVTLDIFVLPLRCVTVPSPGPTLTDWPSLFIWNRGHII